MEEDAEDGWIEGLYCTQEAHHDLHNSLTILGFQRREVPADGDCFFHCLSCTPECVFFARSPQWIHNKIT